MDDLVLPSGGQKTAFIDHDAGGRPCAGQQQIGHHARVIEVPVAARNFLLAVGPVIRPASSRELVTIAIIAKFHDVIDANALIAVVIIIALPDRAKAIDRDLPVIAEVPSEGFDATAIGFATKDQSLLIRFAVLRDHMTGKIGDGLTVFVANLAAVIADVKIKPAIRSEHHLMSPMIVLRPTNARKQLFVHISPIITIGVDQPVNSPIGRNEGRIPQHAHAMRGIDQRTLEKNRR